MYDRNLARQNLLTNTTHKLANINLCKKDTILTLYLHHQCSKLCKKLQAAAGKLKSLRVQCAIKLRKWIKIWQETTVLQS
jgi:hypothetical protein